MSNVNALKLTFNADALFADLIKHMLKAMNRVAEELFYQMQSRTKSQKVAQSLEKHVYFQGYNQIVTIVGSNHWMAFLENYGTGSLMAGDSENPYLTQYMRSGYWNPARPKLARYPVVGRPAGTYYAPDYQKGDSHRQYRSTGVYEGENLEKIKSFGSKTKFTPKSGTFFVETSMSFVKKRFQDIILEAIETFPWDNHKYLKGGG
jgi:hypothetical protein